MHILGQKTRTCFIRIFEQKIKGLFDITFDHNKPLCSQCSWIRQWAKVCCARLIQIDFGQIQLIFSWWESPHLKGWLFSVPHSPMNLVYPLMNFFIQSWRIKWLFWKKPSKNTGNGISIRGLFFPWLLVSLLLNVSGDNFLKHYRWTMTWISHFTVENLCENFR